LKFHPRALANGRIWPMLLKKSAEVNVVRFSRVVQPLSEPCERLIGRSERSIFLQAVGKLRVATFSTASAEYCPLTPHA
jgi:hypothetical protein